MSSARGYAVKSPTSPFEPFVFERRELGAHDVFIKILYCGICHSDIHVARNEWNSSMYPVVPGHEIAGEIIAVGAEVKKFKVGDAAGVGCFVDSCRVCPSCKTHEEQFCDEGRVYTYNASVPGSDTPTYGGYSSHIVVDENYVLKLSKQLPLANTAPLLCAGITMYSPLRRFNAGPGKKVAVVGLGGLGHMGVKLAAAMGAEVTVLSTSPSKAQDAKRLGAKEFILSKDPKNIAALANQFDIMLVTISAQYDVDSYLNMLRKGGVMVFVGLPEQALNFKPFSLVTNRRQMAGSLIGGIQETQEMLDYCAAHNISADIELISAKQIDEAYQRTLKGDVKFRFVIDMGTL